MNNKTINTMNKVKPTTKSLPKSKKKKSNIFDDTKDAAAKSVKEISDTIESGKTINDLLIRRSILVAEIALRKNEIERIDKKLGDTVKKNPLNEFLSKIAIELNKFEPKEINQLLEAIKPLTNLFDISKALAGKSAKEISEKFKNNLISKSKKKK